MTEAELAAEFDRWERKENALFRVFPYFLLGVSTLIAMLQPLWGMALNRPLAIGLSILALSWIAWFYTLHPEWRGRRELMAYYFVGFLAINGCLMFVSPFYGILSFLGYAHAFDCLSGRWRYAGVGATALLMATSQIGGPATITRETWWGWVILVLFNMLVAGAFSFFGEMTHERNLKQKRALVELGEANRKLEAALEENAGLHAQLLVQAREAGVLDERQRMAREIHDTLAQGLAGIITQLQAAEQARDRPAVWQRHVDTASTLARDSLAEARRTVHAVEPAALEEARLPEAIGEVTKQWSAVNNVAAVLTTTGDARPMHPDVEVTLLRTAQEALANVAKHARASRVGLTLSYMEDLVTLDVRDDGVGFAPNVKRANGSTNGGFGLTGMRQRVQRLAGRLEIESEPGAGTAVSATVPAIPAGGVE
ncbi:sensor histidine kinase [Actinophytocola sp.]|uniref:sensor histidine kinase n=1 Tax=Actinophytocola sp. TaxID=1872138 RepID=UPI002ED9ED9C